MTRVASYFTRVLEKVQCRCCLDGSGTLLAIRGAMNRRHLVTAVSLPLLIAACSSAPGDDIGTTSAAASGEAVTTLRGVDSARVFSDTEAKRLRDDHGAR